MSVSSSSSEDDYRSSRSRSRNRKDVKGGKKRARRQSSSRESSEVSPHVRKRKGSRRDDDHEMRKRTGRKKSKRDASVSSSGSGSRSCSTCQSSSDEVENGKRRGRLKRKEKGGRRLEKAKRGSKTSRDRSRSCSSCSRHSEDSEDPIEERVMEESNSRRLKSVITVVKQENESSGELKADEPKEDVYDYDDYPSCKSNDSNDGCSRKELPQYSHVVSETNRPLDDEQGEVSNIRTCSVEESRKDGKPRYDGDGKNDGLGESNKVLSSTVGLNDDDMESILRQRALENLKKFREGCQTNINPLLTQNDKNDRDLRTPSFVNTDPFQIETPQGDDARVAIASQVNQQNRQPPVRGDSTTLPKNDRKTSQLNDDGKYSGTVGSNVASPPAQVVPAGVPTAEVSTAFNYVSNKPKLVMSRIRREAPNTDLNKKQAAAEESSQANLVAKSNVNEGGLETASTVKLRKETAASVSNRPKPIKSQIRLESPNTHTAQKQESAALEPSQAKLVRESSMNEGDLGTAQTPPECVNNGMKVDNALDSACVKPSSSSMSTSGDISSDKLEDEAMDGSQFQQKTMTVMRGGELVQVRF